MDYSPEFKKNFATAYLAEEYERLGREAEEAKESAGSDPELLAMAEEDTVRVAARQAEIMAEIERIVESRKEEESKPMAVILEFRAAAGGDEASLFAQELRDMYSKYAEAKGWKRLATNSAKLVNILGGYGYQPMLGSMEACVEAAVTGNLR